MIHMRDQKRTPDFRWPDAIANTVRALFIASVIAYVVLGWVQGWWL